MKNYLKIGLALLLLGVSSSFFSSCQKTGTIPSKTTSGSLSTTAFVMKQAIVLSSTGTDTVFAVNTCHPGEKADSVGFSALPDSVKSYLTANYSGYTFKKAYKIFSKANVLQGYIVAVIYNGNPVGLKFNAAGRFIEVLEQREGRDIDGKGWHEGGKFGDRDGNHRDTIALSALPASVKTYMSANYASDTLKHSFINRDSSYVVISTNNGIFATEFSSKGIFIKRVQIYPRVVSSVTLTPSTLPAAISTYLTTTYPAYVFDNAFQLKLNGNTTGYLIFIDDNSTKYLVIFNASGNFVKTEVIR